MCSRGGCGVEYAEGGEEIIKVREGERECVCEKEEILARLFRAFGSVKY